MAIRIDAKEIILDDIQPIFGVSDKRFLQLYKFFKSHSRKETYIIENFNSPIENSTIKLFREYGIYFEDYGSSAEDFVDEKQFIIIPPETLEDEITLQKYLVKYCVEDITPGICIIEQSYENIDKTKLEADFKLIHSIIPQCTIINNRYEKSSILDSATAFKKLKNTINASTGNKYQLTEITNLFDVFNNVANINQYLQCANDIVEKIKALNRNADTIFYIDTSQVNKAVVDAYYAIAAYLLLDADIKCYVPLKDFEYFIYIINSARSQHYMFLDDYLHNLVNYPDFSVSCRLNQCYLWVKDSEKMNNANLRKKYNITLTMFKARVNIDTFELLEDFSTISNVVPLSSLTGIKRFRDFSDIGSSDINAAKEAYVRLNRLFINITNNLMESKILGNEDFITVNNVLLFEQGGSHYVAYVADINGIIPFVVFPLIKGYEPFSVDFDIKNLECLYDTRAFYDIDIWCNQIKQKLNRKQIKIQHYDKNTLRGILFKGYRVYNESVSTESPLTFAQIGMWSHQTGDFRRYRKNAFADLFNKKALLQENLFSIFGFKHPQISNEFIIKDEYWRYLNC